MKLTAGQIIDIIFGIIILFNIVMGLWRGVVKEIFGLGGLILALIAASRYSPQVSALYKKWGMPDNYGVPGVAAYISVFLAVWIAVKIITYLIEKFIKAVELSTENRLLGGTFGLLKGSVFVFFIALIIMYVPFPKTMREKVFSSRVMTLMAQNKDKIDKAFGKGSFLDKIFPAAREKLANTKAMLDIGQEVQKDPSKVDKILNSPEVKALSQDPKVKEKISALKQDQDFVKAVKEKNYQKVLANKKLQEILKDPYIRKKIMELNLQKLLEEIKNKTKASTK